MKNVMIDLETLGTQPGSVILSIGAVKFDPTKLVDECLEDEFYKVVHQVSCIERGMTVSQDTLDWWSRQSPEARLVLTQSNEVSRSVPIYKALKALGEFIGEGAKIWSNGANFDQPLLDVAYDRCNLNLPWNYRNSRCYRTIIALYPDEKTIRPATVLAHDALEDAKWQAKHMVNVAHILNLKL